MKFVIEWTRTGVFVARFVDGAFAGRQFGVSIPEALRQFGIEPSTARF